MKYEPPSPFDSIESAHEFVTLFAEAIADSKREIEADIERESNSKSPRRLEAVRLTLYNLDKLQVHVNKSRRILNDLRCLRRLLLDERRAGTPVAQPELIEAPKAEAPVRPFPVTPRPAATADTRAGSVVAA
jgi:hypothetical protein